MSGADDLLSGNREKQYLQHVESLMLIVYKMFYAQHYPNSLDHWDGNRLKGDIIHEMIMT